MRFTNSLRRRPTSQRAYPLPRDHQLSRAVRAVTGPSPVSTPCAAHTGERGDDPTTQVSGRYRPDFASALREADRRRRGCACGSPGRASTLGARRFADICGRRNRMLARVSPQRDSGRTRLLRPCTTEKTEVYSADSSRCLKNKCFRGALSIRPHRDRVEVRTKMQAVQRILLPRFLKQKRERRFGRLPASARIAGRNNGAVESVMQQRTQLFGSEKRTRYLTGVATHGPIAGRTLGRLLSIYSGEMPDLYRIFSKAGPVDWNCRLSDSSLQRWQGDFGSSALLATNGLSCTIRLA